MRSRDCDTYEKLVDTIIADRLKDSLSPQCLEYCLSIEGNKVLLMLITPLKADIGEVLCPHSRTAGLELMEVPIKLSVAP